MGAPRESGYEGGGYFRGTFFRAGVSDRKRNALTVTRRPIRGNRDQPDSTGVGRHERDPAQRDQGPTDGRVRHRGRPQRTPPPSRIRITPSPSPRQPPHRLSDSPDRTDMS